MSPVREYLLYNHRQIYQHLHHQLHSLFRRYVLFQCCPIQAINWISNFRFNVKFTRKMIFFVLKKQKIFLLWLIKFQSIRSAKYCRTATIVLVFFSFLSFWLISVKQFPRKIIRNTFWFLEFLFRESHYTKSMWPSVILSRHLCKRIHYTVFCYLHAQWDG